jgi:hypothetical protein
MSKTYERIDDRLREWILGQPVMFVATAPLAADGHVNVSPKGGRGTVAVMDAETVAYLDYTGSGVETIAHIRENERITLMWCAFSGPPKIVRVHGRGSVVLPSDPEWATVAGHFPDPAPGVRAVVVVRAERISDSCGYAVPLMELRGERDLLEKWAQKKGPDGLTAYRRTKNAASLDGLAGLPEGADQ